MLLSQDNHVVHAPASDRSDQPFSKAVLPRGRWCSWLVPDAHGAQSACDGGAVDRIPITDEVAWSLIPSRIDPIDRSAKPFCQGDAGAC